MSYVKNSLVSGEAVLYCGRIHWIAWVWAMIWISAFFWVDSAWAWIPGLIGIYLLIQIWSTEMTVTDRRIVYKRGFIARNAEELSLHQSEEINLRQGVLGRIIQYGQVVVKGTGGSDITLHPLLSNPMRFKRELEKARVCAERSKN